VSSRDLRGRRPGIGWFLAGYVGVAGFLGLEATTREGGAASSLDASSDDQGTTRRTGFALTSGSLPVAVLVSALLGRAYQRRIAAEEQLLRRDLPSYLAVKVALTPSGLEARLSGLGWRITVTPTSGPFFWGSGTQR
jgi:hypothetical protein